MNNKILIAIIVMVIVLITIFVIAYAKSGLRGIGNVLHTIFILMVVAIIIGIIAMIIYFLFFYIRRINPSEKIYKNITAECSINIGDNLRFLMTTGDNYHQPVILGQIIGYSRRMCYDYYKKSSKTYKHESIFGVRKMFSNPFLDLISVLFMKRFYVRCIEDLHDTLQGDVSINCIGLVKHGYFYYPDNQHLNFRAIDLTLHLEAQRFNNMEVDKHSNTLMLKALGVNRIDKKEVEGMTGLQQVTETRRQVK